MAESKLIHQFSELDLNSCVRSLPRSPQTRPQSIPVL